MQSSLVVGVGEPDHTRPHARPRRPRRLERRALVLTSVDDHAAAHNASQCHKPIDVVHASHTGVVGRKVAKVTPVTLTIVGKPVRSGDEPWVGEVRPQAGSGHVALIAERVDVQTVLAR